MIFSRFPTPIDSANFLIEVGVYPLLRKPEIVGIRGSSQDSTNPFSTNCANLRLLTTV